MKRVIRLDDPLGHLVPPGLLRADAIEAGLITAMEQNRFASGLGIPSVPTRYVVRMNPSDRAWLEPDTEDVLARAIARYAERAGYLIIGELAVEFAVEPDAALGRPSFWAGFAEDDLLVLAAPSAALQIIARA